jgi:oxygen-independent coproporphyrinogen-3 oxidase
MAKLDVDLELILKYNVPGPRYTSYPTAPHFTDAVQWPVLEEKIRENNQTERELSLYFHLPFCRALCWFCGCTSIITQRQDQSARYLEYLKKEMDLIVPMLNPRRRVGQLHFGGGTPTFLLPDEIRVLGEWIHRHYTLAPGVEAGVEIDPRGLTRDHLRALREAGFNRASVGIQDHDPSVQKAVHRIQPRELNQTVVAWVREAGFQSLNIDLVYGLPHQTVASFDRTLEEVLEWQPDRFAIFNYAHVPWMKRAQRVFKVLPSPEEKLGLLKLSIEKLTSRGYVYIGMDHFALETDELAVAQKTKTLQRNFQGYSTHGGADIYAFGMSSISQTDTAYWQNHKELPAYYAALDAGRPPQTKGFLLSKDDQIRRQTIMRLMCDLELDYAHMSQLLGIDFARYFALELASLDDLEADGLLCRNENGLTATDLGRLLIRNVAMRFDAYLPQETERKFSRTI